MRAVASMADGVAECDHEQCSACASSTAQAVARKEQNFVSLLEEACRKRVQLAVSERDDMWREHERVQISFMQGENASMLTALHEEIERLHHELRDSHRRLYVDESPSKSERLERENEQLRLRLTQTERNSEELVAKLEHATKSALLVEQQLTKAINVFKNQLAYQGNKIRQLTEELRERSFAVAQLKSQLSLSTDVSSVIVGSTEEVVRTRLTSKPIDSVPSPRNMVDFTGDLQRVGLVRSVSVTYPGGKPNVVAKRCSYSATNPRSQHLPSLYSSWASFSGTPGATTTGAVTTTSNGICGGGGSSGDARKGSMPGAMGTFAPSSGSLHETDEIVPQTEIVDCNSAHELACDEQQRDL